MPNKIRRALRWLWRFVLRVAKEFYKNKGLLLAGALGYNTLLSIVPLFAVLLVGLSSFVEKDALLSAIRTELRFIVPGQARHITEAISTFVGERGIVGIVGLVVLLFFSSIAFRIFEDAMEIIFHRQHPEKKRSFWVSALLPYLFILLLGLSLILLTTLNALVTVASSHQLRIFGQVYSFEGLIGLLLEFSGLVGLTLILALLYRVVPAAHIRFRHALVGGCIAAVLWEVVRRIVGWYFGNISLVNVLYGSLATVVVVLLTMEIAAFIILLGAQVIAVLQEPEIESPQGESGERGSQEKTDPQDEVSEPKPEPEVKEREDLEARWTGS